MKDKESSLFETERKRGAKKDRDRERGKDGQIKGEGERKS